MNASVSHIVFTLLSIIISAGAFGSYIGGGSKSRKLKRFAILFALLAAYQFFLSYFLFFDNLYFAAWSYSLAVITIFIILVYVLSIALSILGITKKNRNFIYFFVLSVGVLVIGMQAYDFRLPIVQGNGIVDWNANELAARITSLSTFMVSLVWAYSLLANVSSFHGHPRKLKAALLALGGIFLGISGLTTYHSYEKGIAIISHSSAFIGGILILLTLFVFNKKREELTK